MSEFWYTAATAERVYGDGYTAFSLFSGTHLFWLLLCGALCALTCRAAPRLSQRGFMRFVRVLALLMLLDEAAKDIMLLLTGQWGAGYLPFHLCSINIFVGLWYALRPNRLAAELLYYLCLPGAVAALLFPSWTALPIWNFMHLHSSSIHIMLVLLPVLLLARGFRPSPRALPRCALVLFATAGVMYIVNAVLGTNFLFINQPSGSPLTAMLGQVLGERMFVLGYLPALAAVWGLMSLPYYLRERLPARQHR